MDIELYPLLSTIILVVTIATMIFAFFSYLAYRSRERRAALIRRERETQLTLRPFNHTQGPFATRQEPADMTKRIPKPEPKAAAAAAAAAGGQARTTHPPPEDAQRLASQPVFRVYEPE